MKHFIFKYFLVLFLFLSLFSFNNVNSLGNLDNITSNNSSKRVQDIASGAGYSSQEASVVLQRFIQIILGASGTVALVLVIWAGFSYLTSKGDPKKTSQALKMITSGSIGIVLIVSAYSISSFVIETVNRLSSGDSQNNITQASCNSFDSGSCEANGCSWYTADVLPKCIPFESLSSLSKCDNNRQCQSNRCALFNGTNVCLDSLATVCTYSNYKLLGDKTANDIKTFQGSSGYLCQNNAVVERESNGDVKISTRTNSACGPYALALTYSCKEVNNEQSNCNICVKNISKCKDIVDEYVCNNNEFNLDCSWSTTFDVCSTRTCFEIHNENSCNTGTNGSCNWVTTQGVGQCLSK